MGWFYFIFCLKGIFGDREKFFLLNDCIFCLLGEYCSFFNLNVFLGLCLVGYFCINGLEEVNFVGKIYGDECLVGYYCLDKSY